MPLTRASSSRKDKAVALAIKRRPVGIVPGGATQGVNSDHLSSSSKGRESTPVLAYESYRRRR